MITNLNLENEMQVLDDTQFCAVNSTYDKVLVRAPAGSGKTKTLIMAIANYRLQHEKERICAITYTRTARAEMEARLQLMGIYDVEVTTIHVWARNQLEYFSRKYDFKIRIMEEPQIKKILGTLIENFLRNSRLKAINLDILYSYITGSKRMEISDVLRRAFKTIEQSYIKYKRNVGLYDFTDYPLYLLDVLTAYNETIESIDALFVDEFQDVDTCQYDVFNLVNAKKKFFVGDPYQSIFVFRGADGEVFNKSVDFQRLKLSYNYRSYQCIIDFATSVYEQLDQAIKLEYSGGLYITNTRFIQPSTINCNKGRTGGEVITIDPYEVMRVYGNQSQVYQTNVKFEIRQKFNEFMENKPTILCRTNKQVKEINSHGYFDATTVHQAKGLEYNNVMIIDTTIKDEEDLNVAYVALTRAKDAVFILNWGLFLYYFEDWKA